MDFLFAIEMVERRSEVVGRLKALEEGAAPLVTFLQNPNAVQELRADKQYNLHMLNDRYQVCSSSLISEHVRSLCVYQLAYLLFLD